jgi:hypothetical protein
VNYQDLRAVNAQTYRQQYPLRVLGIPVPGTTSWGPLSGCVAQMRRTPIRGTQSTDESSLFEQIHDAGIVAIVQQQHQQLLDWSQTFAACNPLLRSPQLVTAVKNWHAGARGAFREGCVYEDSAIRDVLAHYIRETFRNAGLHHLVQAPPTCRVGAIDPSQLIATIITAVLGVVCPPTAAFAAILEPIIAVIIKTLFASLTTQFAGTFGSAAAAFNAQVQTWATEAEGAAA